VQSWGLSVQEQNELWARWRRGESLRLIARRMGKRGPSIRAFVLQTGGIQQRPPQRAARSLTAVEREEISRSVAAGDSCRAIAKRLGRAPSTVSRELARNGGRSRYRAQRADLAADRRAARPKPCKLVLTPRLRAVVEAKLAMRWSPEQITAGCRWPIPTTQRCGSPMRPSTSACTSGAVGPSLVSCGVACALVGPYATRGESACRKDAASSSTPSRSASGPPRQTGGRCQGIWKATYCSASALGGADPGRAVQLIAPAGRPTRWLAGRPGPPGPGRGHGVAPGAVASLADLGSRQGDGRARPVHS
jgi:DNA-binding CsgD family transcriptional regulator